MQEYSITLDDLGNVDRNVPANPIINTQPQVWMYGDGVFRVAMFGRQYEMLSAAGGSVTVPPAIPEIHIFEVVYGHSPKPIHFAVEANVGDVNAGKSEFIDRPTFDHEADVKLPFSIDLHIARVFYVRYSDQTVKCLGYNDYNWDIKAGDTKAQIMQQCQCSPLKPWGDPYKDPLGDGARFASDSGS